MPPLVPLYPPRSSGPRTEETLETKPPPLYHSSLPKCRMRYSNLWPSFAPLSWADMLHCVKLRNPFAPWPESSVEKDKDQPEDATGMPRVIMPDFLYRSRTPSVVKLLVASEARVTWLGHATVYLRIPSRAGFIGILFDPIFSARCSPLPIGPKRLLPPACQVEQLPRVDAVLISHDHYDHLDKASILQLEQHHPCVQYLVPAGVKAILVRWGVDAGRIHELGWWGETTLIFACDASPLSADKQNAVPIAPQDTEDVISPRPTFVDPFVKAAGADPHAIDKPCSPKSVPLVRTDTESTLVEPPLPVVSKDSDLGIRFICTPAQHHSGRGLLSQGSTLWCSWMIEWSVAPERAQRVFFAGDTGYRSTADGPTNPIYKHMRAAYGAPDLALLPIAPGSVLPYIERILPFIEISDDICRRLHLTPLDALDVARDLGAKRAMGVHWGTFASPQRAARTVRTVKEVNRLEVVSSRSVRNGLDEPTSTSASVIDDVQIQIGRVGQTWTV